MSVEGESSRRPDRDRRVPAAVPVLAMFVLGVVTAFCAAWVSRAQWAVGSVELPWGMLLASVSAGAVMVIATAFGRGPTFAAVVGWASGVVLWLIRPGDAVIASDALGYAFLLLPTAVLLVTAVVAAPPVPERSR